ncbi:MAG: TIGR00730 family Rossman fold protein [Patescibacteria group bacterium]
MDIFRANPGARKKSQPATEDRVRIPLTAEEREMCVAGHRPPRMSDLTWRIFRIMSEFVEGFQFLSTTSREVSIFGSARLQPGTHWYEVATDLGRLLGEDGFTVVTGGGPGIMEAANKGAFEVGAPSIGLNIQLPKEQRINPYVTRSQAFHYFFTRKVMLAASAQAYVYFPGGYGTLDELFEILTLIQTAKSEAVPVVLVGKDYWGGLVKWLDESLYGDFDTINREDLEIFHVVDTAKEAFEIVAKSDERSLF